MKYNKRPIKRIVTAAIPFAAALCAAPYSLSAHAANTVQDGLDTTLVLSEGKFKSVNAQLTIVNTNDFDIKDIKFETQTSDSYPVNEEKKLPEITDVIKAGEKGEFETQFKYDDGQQWGPNIPGGNYNGGTRSNSVHGNYLSQENTRSGYGDYSMIDYGSSKSSSNNSSKNNSSNTKDKDQKSGNTPSTGDTFPIKTIAAVMIASGAALALCVKTKSGKRFLSVLLCTAVCGAGAAQADLIHSSAEDAYEVRSFEIEETINVNRTDQTVKIKITYSYPTGGQQTETTTFDLDTAVQDETTGSYVIINEQSSLSGTLKNAKDLSQLSYSVTDRNNKELMSGELEPAKKWTINDLGMIVGENKITVSAKYKNGRMSTGILKVNNLCEENMEGIDADRDDNDGDGVLNFIEEMYHTDPTNSDTDGDGLTDYEEMALLGTSPLKKDTDKNGTEDGREDADNDGMSNYDELHRHLTDPLSANTEDDEKNESDDASDDTESKFISCEDEEIKLDAIQNEHIICGSFKGSLGIVPCRADLGEKDSAVIFCKTKDICEDSEPSFYKYDEESQLFSKVDSDVYDDGKVTADIHENGIYVLLDSDKFASCTDNELGKSENLEIVFVLNSGADSAYKENCDRIIEKLREADCASVIYHGETAVTASYNKDDIKNAVDNADVSEESADMQNIAFKASEIFANSDAERKIIIVPSKDDTLNVEEGISIYTADDKALLDAVSEITADRETDSNNDGISDYFTRLMCEGKITFSNGESVFGDASYEQVQTSSDFDNDGLKNGEEVIITKYENAIYAKIVSEPTAFDTDGDGLGDRAELKIYGTSPLRINGSARIADVEKITDKESFVSDKYLKLYEEKLLDRLEKGSVFVGNSFFGASNDMNMLYSSALIDSIEDISAQLEENALLSRKTDTAGMLAASALKNIREASERISSEDGSIEEIRSLYDLAAELVKTTSLDPEENSYHASSDGLESSDDIITELKKLEKLTAEAILFNVPDNQEEADERIKRLLELYSDIEKDTPQLSNTISVKCGSADVIFRTDKNRDEEFALFCKLCAVNSGIDSMKRSAAAAERICDGCGTEGSNAQLIQSAKAVSTAANAIICEKADSITSEFAGDDTELRLWESDAENRINEIAERCKSDDIISIIKSRFSEPSCSSITKEYAELYAISKSSDMLSELCINSFSSENCVKNDEYCTLYNVTEDTFSEQILDMYAARITAENRLINAEKSHSGLLAPIKANEHFSSSSYSGMIADCKVTMKKY